LLSKPLPAVLVIMPSDCSRCVMNTTASNIRFDRSGHCNFCSSFIQKRMNTSKRITESYTDLMHDIKRRGIKSSSYDAIVGVSGGVDSSWVLHLAVKSGLRVLAVHMDNGWNSIESQINISNLVVKLGVDYITHIIDWSEYRSLTRVFLDSDLVDIELLYDNAMLGTVWKYAKKFNIPTILTGHNLSSEGLPMPEGWNWYKYDAFQIKYLASKNNITINSFPLYSTFDFLASKFSATKTIRLLDYTNYHKTSALKLLIEYYGYQPYAYKHYESVLTRFYQGHILPTKFKIDKRRLHLSSLIMSGQLMRQDALKILNQSSPYPSRHALKLDLDYFLKKMRMTNEEFEAYLQRKPRSHSDYPTEKPLFQALTALYNLIPF